MAEYALAVFVPGQWLNLHEDVVPWKDWMQYVLQTFFPEGIFPLKGELQEVPLAGGIRRKYKASGFYPARLF